MRRQPRNEEWDEYELSDFTLPSVNIEPPNISNFPGWGVSVPGSAQSVHASLEDWIVDSLLFTEETGKEHGFQVDGYGNVFGIHGLAGVSNSPTNVTLDNDYVGNVALTFHTHPVREFDGNEFILPLFSDSDIKDSYALRAQTLNRTDESVVGPINVGVSNLSANPENEKYAIITLNPSTDPRPKYKATQKRFKEVATQVSTRLAKNTELKGYVMNSDLHPIDVDELIDSHLSTLESINSGFELTYLVNDSESFEAL
jgi:hypothetical protein